MKVLAVHCHPLHESYSAALFERALAELTRAGHDVRVRRLYDMGFEPALKPDEREAYLDTKRNAADVAEEVADLRWCEGLLLVYPTWWYGMPAMIKGWLDRVWLPGVAFGMRPDGSIATDRLNQIRRFVVVTTHGSPWWWIRLWLRDPGRMAVMRGLSRLFSPRVKTAWIAAYSMDVSTERYRARFIERVGRAMRVFDD